LVFVFPTEMSVAHALFWPTLAVAHDGRRTIGGTALLFALLLMLVLTHEGALVLAAAIVATLFPRGKRDLAFLRAMGALLVALSIWTAVKLIFPPGPYFTRVLMRAARHFFDLNIFTGHMALLLLGTIAGYAVVVLIFARVTPARAPIYAALIVAVALAVYWSLSGHALHAADRYYLRTILVIVTPMYGVLAAIHVCRADGRPTLAAPDPARITRQSSREVIARAIGGASLLVMLVHAVETAKFVMAWTKYKAAVAALATGTASDPSLGDPHFVSSRRIAADLNRLSWFSTTPYLSALVADFAPARLVMDPRANNYFWLSCATATANLEAERAVPTEVRRLVRVNACLHR
jgi:hypothetical protein